MGVKQRPAPPDEVAAFSALFDDAYLDVVRFVARRVPEADAEDVVAEAFAVAWRRFADAPGDHDGRRAWLFGIARNCLLNARRSDSRRDALHVRLSTGSPAGTVAQPAEEVDARLDLAAAWQRLRPEEQEVLALTAFDDLDARGAAQVLGISAGGYRLRLMRARRALRRALDAGRASSAPPLTATAPEAPL